MSSNEPRNFIVSVPTAEMALDLSPVPHDVDVVVWPMDSDSPRSRFDIVVPPYMSPPAILRKLGGIEVGVVQGLSIGYEGVAEQLPSGLKYANATTVHEASTAELAVALMLCAQRQLDRHARNAARGAWEPGFTESIADRHVLLLGYGGVGKAIAARLVGFEVEITAVASHARTEGEMTVHGVDELSELLPNVDIVVASLPGGDRTRGLIDDAFLAALPDGGLIVNVGRGSLIDTNALIEHVSRGRIRAALDVTEPEPLPSDHPLWNLNGVFISPHVGGLSTAMRPRVARLVRAQIDRLRSGQCAANVVVPEQQGERTR